MVLMRTTLVGFHERDASGHTSWSQARWSLGEEDDLTYERLGINPVAVNKNESRLVTAEKRRYGDSSKSGVECNGAKIARQK